MSELASYLVAAGAFDAADLRIMLDAFSPIMIVGAFRLPVTIDGMMEASTILNPSTPWTRPCPSTTASSPSPIPQEPQGWYAVSA